VSIVPVYSVAKTYTAIAAVRSLDLESALGRLVPGLPPALADLTLRSLLQHRSGLEDYGGWPEYRAAVEARDDPWPAGAVLERAGVGRPGTFRYSNVGYLLVRRALEEHHGARLFDVLARLVLDPLGIAAAPFDERADWDRCDHPAIDADLRAYHPGWVYPGTFAAEPQEAARGLALVLRGALGADVADALRRSVPVDVPASHPLSPGAGYGLGVMTSGEPATVLGHGGGGPGFALFVASDATGTRWCGEAVAGTDPEEAVVARCVAAVRPGAGATAGRP